MSTLLNDYVLNILVMTLFWGGMAGAWNIMAGYGGLVSLGHAAFFGIGAYATASTYAMFGLSPWLGLLIGVVVVAVLAVAIGWPTLRLRGAFFSLATLVFPIAMEIVANNWPEVTRGSSGIAIPFQPGVETFSFQSKIPYIAAAAIFAGGIYALTRWLHRARFGLYLIAARDEQAAAESLGVRPLQVKMAATVLSAVLTAIGGFFYAQYIFFIDPPSVFSINVSVQIALLAIIGGLGTPLGPLAGSLVMTPLDGLLSQYIGGGPRLLIYGLLLLGVVLLAPHGIVGTIARWRARMK